MTSMLTTHSLVLSSLRETDDASKLTRPLISTVLDRLHQQPGILNATFDPKRSAARLLVNTAAISLGDVVRLIEDTGASVSAIERSPRADKLA